MSKSHPSTNDRPNKIQTPSRNPQERATLDEDQDRERKNEEKGNRGPNEMPGFGQGA
jgi:hypothetical protein